MDYRDLGYDEFINRGLGLPTRKSETETAAEQQDRSISLNQLTVGVLTGGNIQTDSQPNVGVKIIGKTGIDVYGVSVRFLDSTGTVGGMIKGETSGGIRLYSTTGDIIIDSGSHMLRLTYDSLRIDNTPSAEAIAAATHYVVVNFNGSEYKLMLKSI